MGYSPWGHKELDTTEHPNLTKVSVKRQAGRGKESSGKEAYQAKGLSTKFKERYFGKW